MKDTQARCVLIVERYMDEKLGGKKIYKCINCKKIMDRDTNGMLIRRKNFRYYINKGLNHGYNIVKISSSLLRMQ